MGWLVVGFILWLLATVSQQTAWSPWSNIASAILSVVVIYGIVVAVKQRKVNLKSGLYATAKMLENWAMAGLDAHGEPWSKTGEVTLFDLPKIELLEYKSSGSTYTGGNLGVSFPIFGRVRGYAGGSQGQITKNPEVLTIVDTGRLKVTTKSVIFIGEKETRNFEISKMLDVELGPNGMWAKLAMINEKKREGLQHSKLDQITVGMAIGVADEWSKNGQAAGIRYATDLAERIRRTIEGGEPKTK